MTHRGPFQPLLFCDSVTSEAAQGFLHIIYLCIVYLFCFLVNVNEHHKFTTTTRSHCLEKARKECKIWCSGLNGNSISKQQYHLDRSRAYSVIMSKINRTD